jgi:hypothetical protein
MADPEDDPSDADGVPDGAAVFPVIPEELGVHPLLLTALHAIVFLSGSDDSIVNPAAADEAVEYMAAYLQRLGGADRRRVQEDLHTLAAHARQEKWPKQLVQFLKTFLTDYGVEKAE